MSHILVLKKDLLKDASERNHVERQKCSEQTQEQNVSFLYSHHMQVIDLQLPQPSTALLIKLYFFLRLSHSV